MSVGMVGSYSVIISVVRDFWALGGGGADGGPVGSMTGMWEVLFGSALVEGLEEEGESSAVA